MNHRVDTPEQAIDFNNENSNHSANPTFESDTGWSLSRSGGPVLATIYQYSATYSTDTFDAVAALFM